MNQHDETAAIKVSWNLSLFLSPIQFIGDANQSFDIANVEQKQCGFYR